MKIGIMGGTFNPIHNGHLLLAKTAKQEVCLDEVWFMPSGLPAHKSNSELLPSHQRFTMVQLAVKDSPGFIASSFEIDRPGFTYTADTMQALAEEYPQHEFFFIIGGDSLMKFHHWVKPEVIAAHTTLLAAGRNGYTKEELQHQAKELQRLFGTGVILISMPELNVSSNQIRSSIKMHRPEEITEYLPTAVYRYISENELYQS